VGLSKAVDSGMWELVRVGWGGVEGLEDIVMMADSPFRNRN
jgi:hypothetical protein